MAKTGFALLLMLLVAKAQPFLLGFPSPSTINFMLRLVLPLYYFIFAFSVDWIDRG